MNDRDAGLAEVQRLIFQLTKGCGHNSCDSQLCATGRRHTSPRPVRDYNLRTARLIASHVLSSADPSLHLCKFLDPSSLPLPTIEPQLDSRRDPGSFGQHLSDALAGVLSVTSAKGAVEVTSPASGFAARRLREATRGLDALLVNPDCSAGIAQPGHVDSAHATGVLIASLASMWQVYQFERSQVWSDDPPAELISLDAPNLSTSWPYIRGELSGRMHYRPYFDWFAKMCKVIASYSFTDSSHCKATSDSHSRFRNVLIRELEQLIAGPVDSSRLLTSFLFVMMLQYVFRSDYGRAAIVKRGSAAHGALLCLELVHRLVDFENKRYTLFFIWARDDSSPLDKIAQEWLRDHSIDTSASRCSVALLAFPYIFEPAQLHRALRVICHLRMRDTQSSASLIDKVFDRSLASVDIRHFPVSPRTFAGKRLHEVIFRRSKYLVLLVGRDDVLRDTFDQIWQRRRSELLCPLRVRLGDDLGELGQDLGGVQIEYFNLICRAVLREDAGMFTTDSTTGLSWFRVGSLQPLHMFELVGVLLALAIHNGIAIPVSFPIALYKHLLELPIDGLDDIADAWPVEKRTLGVFIDENLEDDHVFTLEANGLRLSITYAGLEDLRRARGACEDGTLSILTLRYEDYSVVNSPRSAAASSQQIIQQDLEWPGWTLIHAPATTDTLTRHSNQQYALDKVDWLTTLSVLPQLNALRRGFHSLLPAPLLAFLSPSQLQTVLEGTPILSIQDWRAATTYTGFSPSEPYIQSFWRVVSKWSPDLQKGLLRFVTSAERVSVSGSLRFKIARVEGQQKLLPTSSTCYCVLSLPVYESEIMLEEKLRKAIEWGGEGFGQA